MKNTVEWTRVKKLHNEINLFPEELPVFSPFYLQRAGKRDVVYWLQHNRDYYSTLTSSLPHLKAIYS